MSDYRDAAIPFTIELIVISNIYGVFSLLIFSPFRNPFMLFFLNIIFIFIIYLRLFNYIEIHVLAQISNHTQTAVERDINQIAARNISIEDTHRGTSEGTEGSESRETLSSDHTELTTSVGDPQDGSRHVQSNTSRREGAGDDATIGPLTKQTVVTLIMVVAIIAGIFGVLPILGGAGQWMTGVAVLLLFGCWTIYYLVKSR